MYVKENKLLATKWDNTLALSLGMANGSVDKSVTPKTASREHIQGIRNIPITNVIFFRIRLTWIKSYFREISYYYSKYNIL